MQHRPHHLLTLALLMGLSCAVIAAEAPDARVIKALLTLHNRQRAEADKPELKLSDALTAVAQRYAEHLAASGKFGHQEQGALRDRLQAAGYDFRRAGENIARGQRTPGAVVNSWLKSPPHRDILLGDFDEVGFGYARAPAPGSGSEITWVAVFATPRQQQAAP